jgi:cell division protein FtsW (lipid II flippase)
MNSPRSQHRFVYSLMTGILILIFWEAFVLGANGTMAGLVPLTGLTESLSAGSHALWMCLLAVTLFVKKGASASIPENGTPDARS